MTAELKQVRQRTTGRSRATAPATPRVTHVPPPARGDRRGGHPPAAPGSRPGPPSSEGRPIDGLTSLWVFLIATMAIVGGVIAANAVDSWWILVPVMLVFFASTFGVLATIMWQLRDDGETT
jgi:hypothetical protein